MRSVAVDIRVSCGVARAHCTGWQRCAEQDLMLNASTNVHDSGGNADAFTRIPDLVVVNTQFRHVRTDAGGAWAGRHGWRGGWERHSLGRSRSSSDGSPCKGDSLSRTHSPLNCVADATVSARTSARCHYR
jgi:hypothetical protein